MKYRKKPVAVEAFQWFDHQGSSGQPPWFIQALGLPWSYAGAARILAPPTRVEVWTLEGVVTANNGDWIIRGIRGELYPCKPDIFAASYEPMEVGRTR